MELAAEIEIEIVSDYYPASTDLFNVLLAKIFKLRRIDLLDGF